MIITKIERTHAQTPKRVAAYVRVSTQRDSQEESFETQLHYYIEKIASEPTWILAGIYSDRRSGTSAAKRPGFQKMMAQAKAGQLDLILVKSISRFARNLLDCQRAIDQLSALGVTVWFERERIRTDDQSSTFVLRLLAAVAQDESRSISQNVRMAIASRYARGEYRLGSNRVLGYDQVDGTLVPNGDAWIIREAFSLCLQGNTCGQIARHLNALGARSLRGKSISPSAIRYILTNEVYVGDRRLQKSPPKDYLTGRPLPDYTSSYLTNDHTPIIDRQTWQQVQELLQK